MKIVIVSIVLNIHQVYIADALSKVTGGQFWFIETGGKELDDKKGGDSDFSKRPYLIQASRDLFSFEKAMQVIREADVMIYGAAPLKYLKERVRTRKILFINSERWLKKGVLNLLSPNLIQQQLFYHMYCHNKPVYALCSSAYASQDYQLMHYFKGCCYKWGYFTEVHNYDIESVQVEKRSNTVRILWVARFIGWKHPEKMLELAIQLRERGVNFIINMIGVGKMFHHIQAQINSMGLSKYVCLHGYMPNSKVLDAMKKHHIYCLTSDKNEGWGAVLNEAMSSGCCPVSSIEAGATPYLVKDGVNGFSFDLKKKNNLLEKVLWLIEHPEERERMSIEAYKTMHEVWCPQNAAEQLYRLCDSMLSGNVCDIVEGPCSKA